MNTPIDWQDAISACELLTGADCEDEEYAFALLLRLGYCFERVEERPRPPYTDEHVRSFIGDTPWSLLCA